ncbi:hypothetical protein RRG08_013184 [Elysia crispata]|uniref:Uncharacterized protein n=1 Tax=Elysia crispata TaxID=231223 RepID=A0AAE1A0D8_9GAST|nr:hypothetical protein RRG08_013184 [Elysia crispata]
MDDARKLAAPVLRVREFTSSYSRDPQTLGSLLFYSWDLSIFVSLVATKMPAHISNEQDVLVQTEQAVILVQRKLENPTLDGVEAATDPHTVSVSENEGAERFPSDAKETGKPSERGSRVERFVVTDFILRVILFQPVLNVEETKSAGHLEIRSDTTLPAWIIFNWHGGERAMCSKPQGSFTLLEPSRLDLRMMANNSSIV